MDEEAKEQRCKVEMTAHVTSRQHGRRSVEKIKRLMTLSFFFFYEI